MLFFQEKLRGVQTHTTLCTKIITFVWGCFISGFYLWFPALLTGKCWCSPNRKCRNHQKLNAKFTLFDADQPFLCLASFLSLFTSHGSRKYIACVSKLFLTGGNKQVVHLMCKKCGEICIMGDISALKMIKGQLDYSFHSQQHCPLTLETIYNPENVFSLTNKLIITVTLGPLFLL